MSARLDPSWKVLSSPSTPAVDRCVDIFSRPDGTFGFDVEEMNKAEVGTGIDIAKLQNIYPQGFTSVLPYDIEVTRSINRGQPVIMSAPNAPVSRKFIEGAMRLVEPAEGVEFHWDDAKPARQGLFARLFRGREHRPQILQEGVMT